ncbi:hypothetical protein Tco_1382402, partial [Tanacetum coccineum]
ANVIANALSRKERVKPKRVRAMNMNLQSSIKDRILVAQKDASDEFAGLQRGIDSIADIAVVLCLELFQSTAPPFKTKTYPVSDRYENSNSSNVSDR